MAAAAILKNRYEGIARQSCPMVRRWRIFGDVLRPVFFSEPRAARFNLHHKFALRPHHMFLYIAIVQWNIGTMKIQGNMTKYKIK